MRFRCALCELPIDGVTHFASLGLLANGWCYAVHFACAVALALDW